MTEQQASQLRQAIEAAKARGDDEAVKHFEKQLKNG